MTDSTLLVSGFTVLSVVTGYFTQRTKLREALNMNALTIVLFLDCLLWFPGIMAAITGDWLLSGLCWLPTIAIFIGRYLSPRRRDPWEIKPARR